MMTRPFNGPIVSYLNSYPIVIASFSTSLQWQRSLKRTLLIASRISTPFRTTLTVSMATTIPTSAFIATPHRSAGRSSAIWVQKAQSFGPSPSSSFGISLTVNKPSVRLLSFKAVRCETKESRTPLVPAEQRWMFEESETYGPDIWNKTWYPKAADHVNTEKTWYIVDATDKILGRMSSTIANYIRGKNLATYTPSVDMGAYVIVINAEKVAVSGAKRSQKLYRRHSGRPGGMKIETFDQLQKRIPERIVEHAVRGMLPKGRLGRQLFTHLKVYKGPEHPHQAQKPIPLPIRDKRIQFVRK